MPALKKLLFEVAYHDLKDATEKRYYTYREQQLLDVEDPSMCAPVSATGLSWHSRLDRLPRSVSTLTMQAAVAEGLHAGPVLPARRIYSLADHAQLAEHAATNTQLTLRNVGI